MSKEEILLKSIKGGKGNKKMSTAEIVNFFKNNSVSLNKIDSHGYNILHYAIKSENSEVVQLILNLDPETYQTEKADPNIQTADSKNDVHLSPLLLTLTSVNDSSVCSKIIKSLIKAGADLNTKDENGCNLFHRACEKGKFDILDYILNMETQKYNINETCPSGSALHMALIGDQEEVVTYLLERNIDLSLRDSNGNTALHTALQLKMNNSFNLIKEHIFKTREMSDENKKALFNAQNEEGNTILHELAFNRSQFLIEMIKKFPAEVAVDPEIKNKEGYTYKGVQENIVKLQKEKEEREKQIKEEIRKQKELLAEERRQELIREKEFEEQQRLEQEKREKLGETLMKYRGLIFFVVFALFMAILFLAVSRAAQKKDKVL